MLRLLPFAQARGAYERQASHDDLELRDVPKADDKRNLTDEFNAQKGAQAANSNSLRSRFSGWRGAVFQFTMAAFVVFCINLVGTIWAISGSAQLYEGDCDTSKTINSGLHILINILSTILLSGSNYCMQCLSAPTREDIDLAHSKSKYLDIGVPGVRNLRHVSRKRLCLWILICVSSLPLHLFYNSAVFGSFSSNNYNVFTVSESFFDENPLTNSFFAGLGKDYTTFHDLSAFDLVHEASIYGSLNRTWELARDKQLSRLSVQDCINAYATDIQSRHRNLFLVSSDSTFPDPKENIYLPNTRVYWHTTSWTSRMWSGDRQSLTAYPWICVNLSGDQQCPSRIQDINPQNWKVGDGLNLMWKVDYCLSEVTEQHCKVQIEPAIVIVVTILNLFKVVTMLYVAFFIKDNPLLTMGDAVESFLDKHDATTSDKCLATRKSMEKGTYGPGPHQWTAPQHRWKDVTTRWFRFRLLCLFSLTWVISLGLFIYGTSKQSTGTKISDIRFGAIDSRATVTALSLRDNLLACIVIANFPQVVLSLIYFAYNALFTTMLLSYEWLSYAHKRAGLRVSHAPNGSLQRSTYFLQLPYRFGIPLVVLSGTMHWLVSQSIFVVAIDFTDEKGGYFDVVRALGYSPLAILSVVILGACMIGSVVGVGYVKYNGGMPLAGSNSLAISAACHGRGDGYEDTARQKVMWGVVDSGPDGVGHCAFSSGEITPVVKGRLYM